MGDQVWESSGRGHILSLLILTDHMTLWDAFFSVKAL